MILKRTLQIACLVLAGFFTRAQQYSGWITDTKNPGLKVRWMINKTSDNYTYLIIQLQSNAGCKLEVTGSVCNTDRNDKNGWKPIQLYKDRPAQLSFKIFNSCNNGFWWWYRNYRSSAVRFD